MKVGLFESMTGDITIVSDKEIAEAGVDVPRVDMSGEDIAVFCNVAHQWYEWQMRLQKLLWKASETQKK